MYIFLYFSETDDALSAGSTSSLTSIESIARSSSVGLKTDKYNKTLRICFWMIINYFIFSVGLNDEMRSWTLSMLVSSHLIKHLLFSEIRYNIWLILLYFITVKLPIRSFNFSSLLLITCDISLYLLVRSMFSFA